MNMNSKSYWDSRFQKDWNELGGEAQSRYFAKTLIQSLPEWIKKDIRESKYSVCDWGCAQGDGTDVFSTVLEKRVSGIDFSNVAIEQALSKYKSSDFIHTDLLKSECENKFDVLISSNTLEHFFEPFDVLKKLKTHVKSLIIVSVPFEEIERIEEHHYSFLLDNIPVALDSEWQLLFHDIFDCSQNQPVYWPGKQVLLVYGNVDWIEKKSIHLSDVYRVKPCDINYFTNKLMVLSGKHENLKKDFDMLKVESNSKDTEIAFLRNSITNRVVSFLKRKLMKS